MGALGAPACPEPDEGSVLSLTKDACAIFCNAMLHCKAQSYAYFCVLWKTAYAHIVQAAAQKPALGQLLSFSALRQAQGMLRQAQGMLLFIPE